MAFNLAAIGLSDKTEVEVGVVGRKVPPLF
jgi:hypothetical protein